jgi:hypothetical protein
VVVPLFVCWRALVCALCFRADVTPEIKANIASVSFRGIDVVAVCVLKIDMTPKSVKGTPPTSCGSLPPELTPFLGLADKPLNAPSKLVGYYFTGCLPVEPPSDERRLSAVDDTSAVNGESERPRNLAA